MSEMKKIFDDLTAGTIGGCSGIFTGQPLDTIKVRVQSAPPGVPVSAYKIATAMIKKEGFKSLYKGMTSPLVGNAPMNALIFAGYGKSLRILNDAFPAPADQGSKPEYLKLTVAGTIAGVVQSFVGGPVELVKCRLQVNKVKTLSPVQVVQQIVGRMGWKGMATGLPAMIARDGPSFGLYFLVYESLKYQLTPKDTDAGMQAMLFSGAAAGVVTWGSTYPFDVIKSIQQTSPDLKKVPSMLEVFKVNYKAHGNAFFWRGLGPTLARAVPVNAVTFVVYEKVLATLTAMNDADEAC